MDTKQARRAARIARYVGHLITFQVETPGSSTGDLTQIPTMILREIKQTKEGHYLLSGLDLRKIHSPTRNIADAYRQYRVDRIISPVTDLGRVDGPHVFPHPDGDGFISL